MRSIEWSLSSSMNIIRFGFISKHSNKPFVMCLCVCCCWVSIYPYRRLECFWHNNTIWLLMTMGLYREVKWTDHHLIWSIRQLPSSMMTWMTLRFDTHAQLENLQIHAHTSTLSTIAYRFHPFNHSWSIIQTTTFEDGNDDQNNEEDDDDDWHMEVFT